MTSLSGPVLAGLLADERRLRVLSAVALGAGTAAEVTAATGLTGREVAAALHRLTGAGLVTQEPALRVALAALREVAQDGAQAPADGPAHLRAFVRDRRLLGLPAQPARRWDVLAHVVQETFEAGVDYDEGQVNALLAPWCAGGGVDHAALRRHLVESGLMSRGAGVYRLGPDGPAPSPGELRVQASGLS